MIMHEPAGVVLAAGSGTRLRPLTDLRPKALCPIDGRSLLDLALERLSPITGSGPAHLAVNANHLAGQVVAHVAGRATVSLEPGEALGTAGGVAALRPWIEGRDVLLTNGDLYLPAGLPAEFVTGWDGVRCRLLCLPAGGRRADFVPAEGGPARYVGVCLLPAAVLPGLPGTPSGLYEVLWRAAAEAGGLDLVMLPDDAVATDCGTPADYLAANLHASGGATVVGAGAQLLGTAQRSVLWDGAYVGPDEHLHGVVRAGTRDSPVTVDADQLADH